MSSLESFAPVPQRAIGDRRLRERDLRVLIAICRAVDARSGIAVISQGRIGTWAGCARQKANASVRLLTELRYIEKVGLRRASSGAGGYLRYRILYAEPAGSVPTGHAGRAGEPDVISGDDCAVITPMDADHVSRAGVTEFRPDDISIEKNSSPERSAPSRDEEGTKLWRRERHRIEDDFRKKFRGTGRG
jgi:hypothetical protein